MSEVKGITWDFDGRQLDIKTALAVCYARGFKSGDILTTAVAVMTAESQRYTKAWHINFDPPYGEPGAEAKSRDEGLFQINSMHGGFDWFDIKVNVDKAYELYRGRGKQFTAWAAFNSGAYLRYVDEIERVRRLQLWRVRVPRWSG